MKALVCTEYGPPDRLRLLDLPMPEPAAGQVRIAVHAASLNFPDVLMVRGEYQVKPELPFVPGAEIAGTVDAIGEGVQGLSMGDRVIGFGGHGGLADHCVKEAGNVVPVPAGMSYESAAAFVLTYGTSLHALKDCGRLQAGETLLVLGAAGGVGLAAVELGKAMGARVIAAASSPEKLALCREKGADAVIDYSRESLRTRIFELTDGTGVDAVYDPVGGEHAEPALRSLRWRGRYLVVGFAAGNIPRFPVNLALLQERQICGVYWGSSVKKHAEEHATNMRLLAEWFAAGHVAPHVSEVVSLDEAPDALARMAARQVMGKVVVRLADHPQQ